MITKGPYHKMFTPKANGTNGLSIDIKPEVRTLVAAGSVFIKIYVRARWLRFVYQDLRGDSEKRDIRSKNGVRYSDAISKDDLVYRNPSRPGDNIQDVELSRSSLMFYIHSRKNMGIYNAPDRKVR